MHPMTDHHGKSPSPFYNKSEIKKRGWTDTAITKFLGSPDRISRNRRRRNSTVHLYLKDRVEKCESTTAWKEWKQKSQRRSDAMKASAAERREDTLRLAEKVLDTIHLTDECLDLSWETLKELSSANFFAIEEKRALHRKNYVPEQITSRRTDKFFHRIAVNYLRHDGTDYDHDLDKYFNMIGVNTAKDMIRDRTYQVIAENYPYLSDECDRQLEHRRAKMRRKGQL